MNTKLTLVLNKHIIERAKAYAASKNTSVSKIIEGYLETVTAEGKPDVEISPLVKSLSGVISIPEHHDYKSGYADHLADKYLHG